MKAYNCFELWLVCSIKRSCSVIVVTFDPELWFSIWKLAVELYADEKPKIPTRLHPQLQEIKLMISKYTRTCCQLLCEVPTVIGDYGEVYVNPNFSSPFSPNNLRKIIEPDIEDIQETSKFIAINSKAAFKACHEVLRTPAKELLVFMLTNKDRKQDKKVPYSYPIAYAMKGPSMSNDDLKFMVRKLRNILYTKNIPILCEAYDGQWHNHIMQSEKGHHLMKLFGRTSWLHISKLSKDKCMEQLAHFSIVKVGDWKEIEKLQRSFTYFENENIVLNQDDSRKLWISSHKFLISQVVSITPKSCPDLFEGQMSVFSKEYKQINNIDVNYIPETTKKRKKQIVGLQTGEKDIRYLLMPELIHEYQEDKNYQIWTCQTKH